MPNTTIEEPTTTAPDQLVPIDYSRYRKSELQQMCRDRRIPSGGGLPELIDRLKGHDTARGQTPMVPAPDEPDPDLSFLVDPAQPEPPKTAVAAPAPPQREMPGPDGGVLVSSASRGELVRPGAYVALYPCPTELTTETHNRFLERIARDAAADGHQVRGGAYRAGWDGEGDDRRAVYEISVRKV